MTVMRKIISGIIVMLIALATAEIHVAVAQTEEHIYRTLYTRYDSIIVQCMYGEMHLLPVEQGEGKDRIQWQHDLRGGVDTTEYELYLISQSKPFRITDSTYLSFFRMISTQHYDHDLPYAIPDTTIWTMELWKTSPTEKLATIDSCGLAKAPFVASDKFPDKFGVGASDVLHIGQVFLGDFAPMQTDSVFITLRMRNRAPANEYTTTMMDDHSQAMMSALMEEQLRELE
jgi:hypothetical protein